MDLTAGNAWSIHFLHRMYGGRRPDVGRGNSHFKDILRKREGDGKRKIKRSFLVESRVTREFLNAGGDKYATAEDRVALVVTGERKSIG